jgi:hypothetical protein
MAVKSTKSIVRRVFVVEAASESTTAVDVMSIDEDTIIEKVLVRIKTPATGTVNLIVGDDDDDDGFIVTADAAAAAGTVYGDTIAEVGAYLKQACGATSGYTTAQKLYTSKGKEIKLVLSGAATTEGVYQVFIYANKVEIP